MHNVKVKRANVERICALQEQLRKSDFSSDCTIPSFAFVMTNNRTAPQVSHMEASLLTNIVFQEMTSRFTHPSKLKRMIQLVAMVSQNVQRGISCSKFPLLQAYLCMMTSVDVV